MLELAIKTKTKIILTHNSRNRNTNTQEDVGDIIKDICKFFDKHTKMAIEAGIDKDNIIIDPGIGFGKTFDDNYRILNNVRTFKECGYPVLIGLSRKSMIGKLFNHDEDRLPATLALNCAAFFAGADIVRVHDVKAHRMAFKALIKMSDTQ